LSGIINESETAYNRGEYYTAASLAYTAYMQCLYTTISEKYSNTGLLKGLAQNILKNITKAREKINLSEKKYSSSNMVPLYSLETIGAAESRLWMSEEYAKEALESSNYNQTAQLVSAALARFETAILWSTLSETRWSSSPIISLSLINKTLDDYYIILNETLEYSETIAGNVRNSALKTYFQELSDLANRISSEGKNNTFLKYGLAGELGYRLLNFLISINTIDNSSVSQYYRGAWVSFITLYSILMKSGLTPLIPAAYSEYAAYEGLDGYTRLSLLEDSIAHTLPLLYYVYGYTTPHRVTEKAVTIGFSRQELALILDGWELIGILSTVIVFLVFFREVLKARKSFFKQKQVLSETSH
jgi:predicted S18 family serine protease